MKLTHEMVDALRIQHPTPVREYTFQLFMHCQTKQQALVAQTQFRNSGISFSYWHNGKWEPLPVDLALELRGLL